MEFESNPREPKKIRSNEENHQLQLLRDPLLGFELPVEINLEILSYLRLKDLVNGSLVSRTWKIYCKSEVLWRTLAYKRYTGAVSESLQAIKSWKVHLFKFLTFKQISVYCTLRFPEPPLRHEILNFDTRKSVGKLFEVINKVIELENIDNVNAICFTEECTLQQIGPDLHHLPVYSLCNLQSKSIVIYVYSVYQRKHA
jgi:hypothetical protein